MQNATSICSVISAKHGRNRKQVAGEMVALLCGMNVERKSLTGQGIQSFSPEAIAAYEQKYDALIAKGREENKKHPKICKER